MAKTPLFSTYRQGENRVTASMLAVFERIDATLVESILSGAAQEASLPFLEFANQVAAGDGAVPDASISASFEYLFEIKTVANAVDADQLRRHLKRLDGNHREERLFAITPDGAEPPQIVEIGDHRLMWIGFRDLFQVIDDLLADTSRLVPEQSAFLLRELQSLFREEGLVDHDDVVVVAARAAYPEYLKHHACICQAGRSFRRGLARMGFYTHGAIQREVPEIFCQRDHVEFSQGTVVDLRESPHPCDTALADLIQRQLAEDIRPAGGVYQVFLLSAPDEPRTLTVPHKIENTATDSSGRRVAWTQGQRYTSSAALAEEPRTTDGLVHTS